jgi:hypothetical protein
MITYNKKDFFQIKLTYKDEIPTILKEKLNKINAIIGKIEKNPNKKNENWRKTKPKFIKKFDCKEEGEINSNLNKISPKNFNNIAKNIITIINKNKKVLPLCIENIFKKAVNQPTYCEYYVKLFTIFIDNKFEIQDLINEKCKLFTVLLEYKLTSSESEEFDYDEFCKSIKEKTYKNGFSQFIGELANYSLIDLSIIHENIDIFITNLEAKINEDPKNDFVEDNILCLSRILTTCKDKLENKAEIIAKMEEFKSANIIKRLKFKIMDLLDELKI